jgi:hypothetical protein
MSALAVASIAFVSVCGGTLAGLLLRVVLPEHHLSVDSKDVVKLVTALIATLSALVLGLLIASAKSSFDTVNDGLRQSAARTILLDRVLAQYGPGAREVRDLLRTSYAARVEALFPADGSRSGALDIAGGTAALERVQQRIRALSPENDAQRSLQSRAGEIAGDIAQARWMELEEVNSSIPVPFLVVLVSWLAAMFASFGMFAPRNATALVALLLGALSVSTAIFLIEELNNPLDGFIAIPQAPMRDALAYLGK